MVNTKTIYSVNSLSIAAILKRHDLKQKILWTITGFLFAGHLILQYGVFNKYDFSEVLGQVGFTVDFFSNTILIFGIGATLGALIAFIPFGQQKYGQKFKTTFPLTTSLLLVGLICSFGYAAYLEKVKGIKLTPLVKYDSVEIPNGLDCSAIKDGNFETADNLIIIERQGDKQIQTNKDTKEKTKYKVEWLSDCEYCLTPLDRPTEKLKVKIVSVTADSYDYFVASDKYATRHTIKRRQ